MGDFNIPLISMDRSSRRKISKEALTDILDQMNFNVCKAFQPKAAEYTLISKAHGTFSRIDHIFGHRSKLSKFKKTEIVSSIFSDHNTLKLDIN